MKRNNFKYVAYFAMIMFLSTSCKDKNAKNDNLDPNLQDSTLVDSSDLGLNTDGVQDFNSIKEIEPSSPEEVKKMVDSGNLATLDDYQKFAQEFINACGTKNYEKASKYMSYLGSDKSRLHKDHFNYSNAKEKGIVKTTADVVFTFLAESNNYKFISAQEVNDPKAGGKKQVLEITFFKKGMGVNRRFFEIIDTPKGMLIYNMR